jgi:hypothetical protein
MAYYAALAQFHQDGHKTEGNTRSAFADLLKKCAHPYDWHLVEEYQFKGTAKPPLRADGTLVDSLITNDPTAKTTNATSSASSARSSPSPSKPRSHRHSPLPQLPHLTTGKLFFTKNLSKNACQAPKPPNSLQANNIRVAF